MNKRKFKGQRLYKLTKWLVIIISIPTLLLGILGFYSSITGENDRYITHWLNECNKEPTSELFNSCIKGPFETVRNSDSQMKLDLEIGFGLPVLFFGGIALYKYLFPLKKQTS